MKLELKLETVTPLFLGGARQQPEFRPSSVRGVMRYWLRALLGGTIGDRDLTKLHQTETEIFGDTDHGSAVTVRLVHNFDQRHQVKEPLLPHRRDQTSGETPAIPCGTPFSLTLSLRPCEPVGKLESAAWCALVWLTIGGIGRRSRRGEGSLKLTDFNFSEHSRLLSQDIINCLEAAKVIEESGAELANRIGHLIDNARRALPASSHPDLNDPPLYSLISSNTRIVVWIPGHTNLKDYKLPLITLMNRLSHEKSLGSDSFAKAFGSISRRRASPLHITAHRLANEWALVCTHLKAKIQADDDGQPQKVTDFLNALTPKFEAYPRSTQGGEA